MTARMVTARATWSMTSRAPWRVWKSNGPSSAWYGPNGGGASGTASRPTSGAAAAIPAHQRQRGEGSVPVGVNSMTKPMHASDAIAKAG